MYNSNNIRGIAKSSAEDSFQTLVEEEYHSLEAHRGQKFIQSQTVRGKYDLLDYTID